MSRVLLGLCDQSVGDDNATSWKTNKIGGSPDWMSSELPRPTCRLCRQLLNFVGQMYCPLSGSDYHRTLYVFVCHRQTCLNDPQSWLVLRSHTKVSKAFSEPTASTTCITNDWGTVADDWGCDADEWGSEADDWGSEVSSGSSGAITGIDASSADLPGNVTASFENLSSVVLPEDFIEYCDNALNNDATIICDPNDALMAGLKVLSFCDDGDDRIAAAETAVTPAELLLQGSPLEPSPGDVKTAQCVHYDDLEAPCLFESHYVCVIDEPELEESLDHEHQLLRKYAQQEGVNVKGLCSVLNSAPSGPSEAYEKTSVRHGDNMFYKFTERISRCPQQIIRYSYGGEPLLAHTETRNVVVPCCRHCGSNRIFELQLMPALVSHLCRSDSSSLDPVVEFQSVHIYTCQANCWLDDATAVDGDAEKILEEYVVIERDTDESYLSFALSKMASIQSRMVHTAVKPSTVHGYLV